MGKLSPEQLAQLEAEAAHNASSSNFYSFKNRTEDLCRLLPLKIIGRNKDDKPVYEYLGIKVVSYFIDNKSYPCPMETKGMPGVLHEVVKILSKLGTPEADEWLNALKSNKRTRFLLKLISRADPIRVQIMESPVAIYDELMRFQREENECIWDIVDGFDWRWSKEGGGLKTDYFCRVARQPSRLMDSRDEEDALLKLGDDVDREASIRFNEDGARAVLKEKMPKKLWDLVEEGLDLKFKRKDDGKGRDDDRRSSSRDDDRGRDRDRGRDDDRRSSSRDERDDRGADRGRDDDRRGRDDRDERGSDRDRDRGRDDDRGRDRDRGRDDDRRSSSRDERDDRRRDDPADDRAADRRGSSRDERDDDRRGSRDRDREEPRRRDDDKDDARPGDDGEKDDRRDVDADADRKEADRDRGRERDDRKDDKDEDRPRPARNRSYEVDDEKDGDRKDDKKDESRDKKDDKKDPPARDRKDDKKDAPATKDKEEKRTSGKAGGTATTESDDDKPRRRR